MQYQVFVVEQHEETYTSELIGEFGSGLSELEKAKKLRKHLRKHLRRQGALSYIWDTVGKEEFP